MKANDELRIGIIGAGGRGCLVRHAHVPGKGSRVVALCDTQKEAFDIWQDFAGPKAKFYKTDDYRKLLARKDIDAVFITVPDFLHEEMAVAALEACKAVYMEKPMAITIEGCDKILETAKRTGTKLFVGHNMRHMRWVHKMKELIDQGTIGNIQAVWCRHFINYGGDAFFKDWHSERKYTTGLLVQKAAHDVDVIHWLAGGYTKRVVGMGRLSVYNRCKNRRRLNETGRVFVMDVWPKENWPPLESKKISPVIDVEDASSIMMQLDNGVMANYMQCHYTPDECRNYTFIGDAGRIENRENGKIDIYTTRGDYNNPDMMIRPSSAGAGTHTHGNADYSIVNSFVKFAKGEEHNHHNLTPIAARNAVATCVLGTDSIRDGNMPKDVPPVNKRLNLYFNNGQKENHQKP